MLGDSMSQLKVAQQKFVDSKENVKKLINKESGKDLRLKTEEIYLTVPVANIKNVLRIYFTGKPILVPLTSSVSF